MNQQQDDDRDAGAPPNPQRPDGQPAHAPTETRKHDDNHGRRLEVCVAIGIAIAVIALGVSQIPGVIHTWWVLGAGIVAGVGLPLGWGFKGTIAGFFEMLGRVAFVVAVLVGVAVVINDVRTPPVTEPENGSTPPPEPAALQPDWSPWTWVNPGATVPGADSAQLAATTSADDSLDVFVMDQQGRVWSTWREGAAWRPWSPLYPENQEFEDGPRQLTAVSRPPTEEVPKSTMRLFAIGDDGKVWATYWDGRSWSQWMAPGADSLPTTVRFDPRTQAVTALWRSGWDLDLFVTAEDGQVWSTHWDARKNTWGAWYLIPSPTTTSLSPTQRVAAVARNQDALDLFTIGAEGRVLTAHWQFPQRGWTQWSGIPESPVFDPITQQVVAVSRPGSGTVDVVAISHDKIVQSAHSPEVEAWVGWKPVWGKEFDAANQQITGIARTPTSADLFTVAPRSPGSPVGELWSSWWDPAKQDWRVWFAPPVNQAPLASARQPITAVARHNGDEVDLLAIGENGGLWTAKLTMR